MTDAELRDAAVAELELTTAGWRKSNGQPHYPSGTAPATSHWGKAMSLLEHIGQSAPPPPPPPPPSTDFSIPTYELALPSTSALVALWVTHYSPTIPYALTGGTFLCREANWATAGYEYWMLTQFYIASSYGSGNNAARYSVVLDMHPVGGETGWDGVGGVSPMHIKYRDGNLMLQHEPNNPNEWVVASALSKDVWHSLVVHVIFGRSGFSVPGHPNGGMGRTRIWLDGSDSPFDTGNVSNIWGAYQNLAATTRLTVLEGTYGPNSQASFTRMTAQRWGTTLSAALADSQITRTGFSPTGGVNASVIASRNSSDFVLPPSLEG